VRITLNVRITATTKAVIENINSTPYLIWCESINYKNTEFKLEYFVRFLALDWYKNFYITMKKNYIFFDVRHPLIVKIDQNFFRSYIAIYIPIESPRRVDSKYVSNLLKLLISREKLLLRQNPVLTRILNFERFAKFYSVHKFGSCCLCDPMNKDCPCDINGQLTVVKSVKVSL